MDRLAIFWDYLSEQKYETDFVDRLNFRLMPRILVIFATIILAKEYGGNPISCWSNAEFTGSYTEYVNDYCFVEGTYYATLENEPERVANRYRHYRPVDYYAWLAFLLAFQAILFYMPYFCWSAFNNSSGLSVRALITMAHTSASGGIGLDNKDRMKISTHIYNSLRVLRKDPTSKIFSFAVKFYRNYVCAYRLVAMYILLKVTFLVVAIVQLKFISKFLGKSANIWDFYSSIDALLQDHSWEKTGNFPRVGFCDFEIRGLEMNVQTYTVQCVLMANMINEKIFVAVWWCLWFMTAIGTLNLIHWLINLFFPGRAFQFVHRAIFNGNSANLSRVHDEKKEMEMEHSMKLKELDRLVGHLNDHLSKSNLPLKSFDQKKIKLEMEKEIALEHVDNKFKYYNCDRIVYEKFMDFIGLDTVLLFRLMELNSSAPVVNEILSQLFHDFVEKRIKNDKELADGIEEVGVEQPVAVTTKSANFLPLPQPPKY